MNIKILNTIIVICIIMLIPVTLSFISTERFHKAKCKNLATVDLEYQGGEKFKTNVECDIIVMRDSSIVSCIIMRKTRKEVKVVDCPNTGVRTILLRKNIFSINGNLEKKVKKKRK